jgi:uncharacterized RmlC-like cupin family protein
MPEAKPVIVTKSDSLVQSGGQTDGMIRQNALVNVAEGICASRMIAKPKSGSAVHHHGDQDTVVFAFSGHGTIVSDGGKKKQKLEPGDYALIPAWAEHQEVNESDEDVVWCIVRSGKEPKVSNRGPKHLNEMLTRNPFAGCQSRRLGYKLTDNLSNTVVGGIKLT